MLTSVANGNALDTLGFGGSFVWMGGAWRSVSSLSLIVDENGDSALSADNEARLEGEHPEMLGPDEGADQTILESMDVLRARIEAMFAPQLGDVMKDVVLQFREAARALQMGDFLNWSGSQAAPHSIWYEQHEDKLFMYADFGSDGRPDCVAGIDLASLKSWVIASSHPDRVGVTTIEFGDNDGHLALGESIRFTVTFSADIDVSGGRPLLTLSNGATAVYASGSGSRQLVFVYTPAAGEDTPDLTITGLDFNGARLTDSLGATPDVSAVIADLPGRVTVDTTPPAAPAVSLEADTGVAGDAVTKDGALNIDGEAGATILYSVVGGNSWSSSFTPSEGSNTVLVRQTDVAGNISASTSFSFTLDTVAPAAPVITGYSDDTGIAGDGVTADNTLLISGTAAAFAPVTLYVSGASTATLSTTAGADCPWSIQTSELAYGQISFTATVSDEAGNVSAPSNALGVFSLSMDMTILSGSQGFIIQGDSAGDNAGRSVSSAGDINGDGFDDVIVGAIYVDDGGVDAGEAYVLFGSASGIGTPDANGQRVIDLTTLTSAQGFIIQGDTAGDWTGRSVSSAGDVNGDGFDDLLVSADTGDDGGSNAGEAYVVFGTASGFGTVDGTGRAVIDLTSLAPAQGFVIQGDTANNQAGMCLSVAGDVNGDGFSDLMVGAIFHNDAFGTHAGKTYIVFGAASGIGAVDATGRQVIDLTNLTAQQGILIVGDATGDWAGWAVSSAGDMNGDGFDDLVVGAIFGDDGGGDAGEAYVVFGKPTGFGAVVSGKQVIDLTSFTPADGFIIQGDAAGDYTGYCVSAAGDINGDGFDDLIVGAPLGDDGGTDAGEAHVIFGSASGFGTAVTVGGVTRQVIDLTSLTPAQGFIIQGDLAGDWLGYHVSDAGDINGDGFDDLIVGAPAGDDGGIDAGEAYVIFGSAAGFGTVDGTGRRVLDLTTLTAAQGFIIQGDTAGDFAGGAVSSAGDINGDGFDDLIVSAYRGDLGGVNAGQAYVIYGGTFGGTVVTTGTAAAELLVGATGNDTLVGGGGADSLRGGAGNDILAVSDTSFRRIDGGTGADTLRLDGTGMTLSLDTIAPSKIASIETIDLTGTGNNSLTLDRLSVLDITEERSGGRAVLTINGNAGDSVSMSDMGWAYRGTVTTDGVSYGRYTNGGAEIRVQAGVNVASQVVDVSTSTIIIGDAAGDYAGQSVASVGDVNGDGFEDVIISASLGDDGGANAGEAYVIFGSASGIGTADASGQRVIDLTTLTPAQGFIIQGDTVDDNAGGSVAPAGDVNGDGYDDLIVGAFVGDDGGSAAGEAYVVFGSASGIGTVDATGRAVIDLTSLSAAQGFIIQGDVANDQAGVRVFSAGDMNGDGFADVVVGARYGDDGGSNAGEAYVIFGSAAGFGTAVTTGGFTRQVVDLTSLTAAQGFIVQGDVASDQAGFGVALAGDVNGDGFDDVIIGAPFGDDGGTDAGEAYVVFGTAAGFGTAVTAGGFSRRVIDLTTLTATQGFIIQGDVAGDNAGFWVATAGDVNGDGIDDMIIGARTGDDGGTDAGEAYVVYGSTTGFGSADAAGRRVIDLTTLSPAQGFIIQGDAAGDNLGHSVASAGDINGDGFDDVIVGAIFGDDGGINSGEAYVIFGSAVGAGTVDATGRRVIDLTMLTPAAGLIIQGNAAGDNAGNRPSGAGDINGDGFDDLIVAARLGDLGGVDAGQAYVIYGGAFGGTVVTTGTAAAEVLIGSTGNDTLTGGGGADSLRGGAGNDILAVSDTGFLRVDGGTGTDTLRLDGAGMSLSLDTIAPSKIASIEAIDLTGTGSNSLTLDRLSVLDITEERSGGRAVLTINGNAGDSVNIADFGWGYQGSITSGGISYERYVSGNAEIRVQAGVSIAYQPVLDLSTLSPSQGFLIQGDVGGDTLGWSVAAAGDVNGDGFEDMIIGNRLGDDGGTNAGESYVVFGSAGGIGTVDATGRRVLDLTSMSSTQGFIIQGDTTNDWLGRVSAAGDINSDGFDDVIVGAPLGDDGGNWDAGEAYVVFGSASSIGTVDATGRRVVDLTALTAAQGFIIQADVAGDQAGWFVSSAGDVNGDGFEDMLVGAPRGDDGGADAGEAYVVFGAASGFGTAVTTGGFARQVIDLTTLTAAQGFIIQGDVAGDLLGNDVSPAGDINGDGFDDFLVGANQGDDGGAEAGEAYLIFGSSSGFGSPVSVGGFTRQVIDLTALTAAQGFIIQGDVAGDQASRVAAAGDINGDGFDDFLVGAGGGDDGGTDAGEVYVIFGSSSGFGTVDGTGRRVIDLTTLSPAQGFIIQGDTAGDGAGSYVASAGDVNGDGFDDLIVGAGGGDDGGTDAGESYVIFGSASGFGTEDGTGRRIIDLTGLSITQGFIIQGDVAGDRAGIVSSAGDVNGDGFDDLMVGARYGDDGGTDAGEAYIIYGSSFGGTVVTTGTAAAELLIGSMGNDTLTGGGGAVSLRGGSGNDILAVSDMAFRKIDGGTGTDTLRLDGAGMTLSLDTIAPSKIASIETINLTGTGNNSLTLDRLSVLDITEERSGRSSILTVNGNAGDSVSFSDAGWTYQGMTTVSGVNYARYTNGNAEVRVQDGVSPVRLTIDLTSLSAAQGFIIQGDVAGDQAGGFVASAGDVNGDGFDDLFIGARYGDDGGANAGEAYVIFGSASGFGTVDAAGRRVIDLTTFIQSQGFIIQGDFANDWAGRVAPAGDVNGDGFDDMLVGAQLGDDGGIWDAGEAYVVFGSASGFGTVDATGRAVIDLTSLSAAQGFIIQGDVAGDQAGRVGPAGDVNGDGFDDVIVGAIFGDDGGSNAGESYVVFGSALGFGAPVTVGGFTRQVIDLTTLTAAQGFVIQGDAAGDNLGHSVASAGDVNGDGFDDVIIAAPLGDDGGTDAGEAYVVFGSSSGFGSPVVAGGFTRQVIDLTTLTAAQGFIIQGDAAGDAASQVSPVGDINGDGFADLVVGANGGDDGGANAGEAYVIFGSSAGLGTVDGTGRRVFDLTTLAPSQGFIIQGDSEGDAAGANVYSAGDFNGDGFDDLIVGAPGGDDGGIDAGEAYVIFGSAAGFGTVDGTGRRVLDLTMLTTAQGFIIQGDAADDRAGSSVAAAGDINGDGFADLVVGANLGDDGGSAAGESYVIFGGAFGRTVVTTGTVAAELLIGSIGNDTLTGNGGADSLRGGAGNDILAVSDTAFRNIDGGTGADTLRLDGSGINLQLDSRVDGVEIFNIAGSGVTTLEIEGSDVIGADYSPLLDFTGSSAPKEAIVEGDADDSVILFDEDPDGTGPLPESHSWQLTASGVGLDGSAGGNYDYWSLYAGGTIAATLAIDADIDVILFT
jgi:hypothetical protein